MLFIDEVEEIASVRSGTAVDPSHGVTNELLKLIPGFRGHDDRLLICATNSVRSLDPAFLRPGRFDYVIPVGPPDPQARSAIWRRYLGPAATHVDLHRLVEASAMFTAKPISSSPLARVPQPPSNAKSPRGKASRSARRTTCRPSPRPVPHSLTRH